MKLFFRCSVLIVPILFILSCGEDAGSGAAAAFKVYGAPNSSSVTSDDAGYGSPNYLTVKLYTVWLSANTDCTNPVVLQDYGTDGKTFNMFDNPLLGAGNPTNGTYNCMIVKQSDTSTFKPEISHNNCVAGQIYTYDIATASARGLVDKDMNPITTTDGEDIVYVFATMDAAALEARGVPAAQIINLTSAFVSPGKTTLVLDFTNQVTEVSGKCWLDKSTVSFK